MDFVDELPIWARLQSAITWYQELRPRPGASENMLQAKDNIRLVYVVDFEGIGASLAASLNE